jgi:hypothetical protein
MPRLLCLSTVAPGCGCTPPVAVLRYCVWAQPNGRVCSSTRDLLWQPAAAASPLTATCAMCYRMLASARLWRRSSPQPLHRLLGPDGRGRWSAGGLTLQSRPDGPGGLRSLK